MAFEPLEDYKSVPRRERKRCIKCRKWYMLVGDSVGFGKGTCSDGFQSICKNCRGGIAKTRRDMIPAQRLRHHFSTRMTDQLGNSKPEDFGSNVEKYLGYTYRKLASYLAKELKEREGPKRRLRDALNEGYHVDHIKPLRSFPVLDEDGQVDWEIFRECWAMTNLRAIPSDENLKKGGREEAA